MSRKASEDDPFRREAQAPRCGLIGEFWDFICQQKKWWLLPIVLVIILLSAIVILGGSPAAPFIYTLF